MIKRLILLLALCVSARAAVFQIHDAPYFDGTHYVAPYNSILDGQSFQSFCVDFTHTVGFGQNFDVTVVNLHNFVGPMHDNYWEAGYLALQIIPGTSLNDISEINRAIWRITTPGSTDPYLSGPGVDDWILKAQENFTRVSDSAFTILLADHGQNQLIIGAVPEPETYACFILGGVSLIGFHLMGRRERAKK